MCGILCFLHGTINCESEKFTFNNKLKNCINLIKSRGPDSHNQIEKQLCDHWYGHFFGSVLWTQGKSRFPQPSIDDDGNILLWNGDIFSGSLLKESENADTKIILDSLRDSSNVKSTLDEVEGPFSFIYYQKSTNLLYFGRDCIGRHSLLMKVDDLTNCILISSVATKDIENVIEVPAIGIFSLDLNVNDSPIKITCYPWICNQNWNSGRNNNEIIAEMAKLLNVEIITETIQTKYNIKDYTIPSNIDTIYSKETSNSDNMLSIMDKLLENTELYKNVTNLLSHLYRSIDVRIKTKPEYCKNCLQFSIDIKCFHSKVGILFSGGLDSAIIAVITDKFIPMNETIDLINVAFEKKVGANYEVPDRVTGKSTYHELLNICPNRKWNFVEVNISQEKLQRFLPHIANLVYPLDTILDESLGCAVYFASRAEGVIYPSNDPYESPARILLLGMGADELFGGYMRHRTTLKRNGWSNLIDEVNHELARISTRNLARDDRIVSDNGRQARYPYLDERLIEFVDSLKLWERCYPTESMPCGLGDKLLLRLAARKLGLHTAATFPKRAFQFGSRIANSKENAKDKSNRL